MGSPFSLRFWGPFREFGDPQHKFMFTVDTRRFSGPCHEFIDVNIAHNAMGSQWLASYSVAIVDLAILKKFTQLHNLQSSHFLVLNFLLSFFFFILSNFCFGRYATVANMANAVASIRIINDIMRIKTPVVARHCMVMVICFRHSELTSYYFFNQVSDLT